MLLITSNTVNPAITAFAKAYKTFHDAYDFHTFEFLKHRWESQLHTVLSDIWNIFAPDSTSPPPGQPAVLVISLACISHPSLPRSAEPGCSATLGDSRSTAAGVRGLIISTAPTAPQLRFSNKVGAGMQNCLH